MEKMAEGTENKEINAKMSRAGSGSNDSNKTGKVGN